ncbi:hypothetical protein G6L37_01755 [Agrobacterium rubi]|nr:hypothetical protein [Agrobacterium rubi]NTF24119.1 hypothetical protein [Agrobacterium rubi]
MRLYRFEGTDKAAPVSDWVMESDEYRNMVAASGRWFADSFEEALWYRCDHENGHLLFIDLDDDVAEQWRVSSLAHLPGGRMTPDNPAAWSLRPDREFYLPVDLARLALPLDVDAIPETEDAALHM